MKFFTIALLVGLSIMTSPVLGQELDARISHLHDRILSRVPDIPSAARGLGRGDARSAHAMRHAEAIIHAADMYAAEWEVFAEQGEWSEFDAHADLPALIAAIAYRESAFQPVIRLDNNEHVYRVEDMVSAAAAAPISAADALSGRGTPRRTAVRGDMGFMQIRIPGSIARTCGATSGDKARLIEDYAFNYQIGTCILTHSLASRIESYASASNRRMQRGQRPNYILRFFEDNPELQGLVVIERYNWGGNNLYQHRTGAGYAHRVLREFLFFRSHVTIHST